MGLIRFVLGSMCRTIKGGAGCLLLMFVLSGVPAWAGGGSALPKTAWEAYKNAFISSDGRVIDRSNGDISHSEGQGYGLLLALLASDRPAFESIWQWTQRNLRREDGLFAWQWHADKTPHVTDWNNATDGDLLIAWALARAGQRWSQPDWIEMARTMARRLRETIIARTPFGLVILPAQQGFERNGSYTLNPSYWVFPSFEVLATVDDPKTWGEVQQSGRKLLAMSQFPAAGGVVPDWVVLHPDARLALPMEPVRRRFGYEALRIPLYLCWAGIVERDLIGAFLSAWRSDDHPAWVDLASGERAAYGIQRPHRAVRSVAQRCTQVRSAPPDLSTLVDPSDYYGSTLMLFATLPFPGARSLP